MAPSHTDLFPSLALEQHFTYWGLPQLFMADMWHGRKNGYQSSKMKLNVSISVLELVTESLQQRQLRLVPFPTCTFAFCAVVEKNADSFIASWRLKKIKFSVHHVGHFPASVQFSSLTGCFTVLRDNGIIPCCYSRWTPEKLIQKTVMLPLQLPK